MRIRIAAYVLRRAASGPELLVFDQAGDPEAGTQIPAGGVRAGEPLREAVLREVAEETGLTGCEIVADLGVLGRVPQAAWDAVLHLILPAIALGTIPLAIIVRITRASVLDVVNEDYVRTANA